MLTAVANGLASDVRADAQSEADSVRSHITIINDPARVVSSPSLVLYVKNTGHVSLDPTAMAVLVDGSLASTVAYDVIGSTDDTRLPPGEVLTMTVTTSLASGDHRVRVVAGPGAADDLAWSG